MWKGWVPNVQRAALVNLGGMKNNVMLYYNLVILQCFDAVGWATGTASSLKNFLLQNPLYEN